MTSALRVSLATITLLLASRIVLAEEPGIDVRYSQTYTTRDTGPLEADVYMPTGKGPFPAMLVVHGGAWRMGSRAQLAGVANAFAEHGYTAVAISYRLAPKSKFPAQIYDCEAAVRWMRAHAADYKIDPQRIGGYGYSAGGHLVALLGTLDDKNLREESVPANAPSCRLQCVLAGGAPCDFRDMPADSNQLSFWLGGTRSQKPENYRDASPAKYIAPGDPPMFFFSGEDDELVPISSPKQMVKELKNAGDTAEMYPIKNAGHLQAIYDRGALQHALAFADKYLKADSAVVASGNSPKQAGWQAASVSDGRAPAGGGVAPARANDRTVGGGDAN
jgi:acetyl esterase/lipase